METSLEPSAGRPAHLRIEGIHHRYGSSEVSALDGIDLVVGEGEVLALIGGSGSGKSTLLKSIAGLERPTRGSISMDGQTLVGEGAWIPTEKRRIGLVAQSGDLFPHLTIERNIAYGLRKLPRSQRKARVAELLEMVGLPDFGSRYPAELSGGEAQRVALARALANEPRLLLLDEPFSNLDACLREHLRSLTLEVIRSRGIATVFVTHHGDDALASGDRIVVMRKGRMVQCGTPSELWNHPADSEVAALFGEVSVLPSNAEKVDRFFRADQLCLAPDGCDCLAAGRVERIDFRGSCQHALVRIQEDAPPVSVCIAAEERIDLGTRVGIRRLADAETSREGVAAG